MPLIQSDFAKMACMDPNCDCKGNGPVVLSGRCHPGAPQKIAYRGGVLYCSCAICGAATTEIQVSETGQACIPDQPEPDPKWDA